VLAVSGLHVGILYLVLERLLFLMRKRKELRRVQSLIIVLVIWLFAFVTGLSGSVVRAAMMFSLIALGKNWNLTTNPFNGIASSALIILLWNPLLIMDVGFQLSYAAVISISAFVSHMNWWMVRETKFGDFFMEDYFNVSLRSVRHITTHYFLLSSVPYAFSFG
jgi:competence protein ComEC